MSTAKTPHPFKKNDLARWIYRRLFKAFGPQGWWPVAERSGRRARYHPRNTLKRLSSGQAFEMAVGAFLTQNTAWTNVSRALENLRLQGALSPEKLASVAREDVENWIRPAGYFRQKTRAIQGFARFLLERWEGQLIKLLALARDEARRGLLGLRGVGPETADSILLYAGGHPVFVVDAYTRRIGRRMGLFQEDGYGVVQDWFESRLPAHLELFREYHALLVELAKRHCKTVPRCDACPLRPRCPTGHQRRSS